MFCPNVSVIVLHDLKNFEAFKKDTIDREFKDHDELDRDVLTMMNMTVTLKTEAEWTATLKTAKL